MLEALGPDGILINVARGSVVDEAALIKALKDKTILSAGLDVFANEPKVPQELIGMENVVLLPHVGSASHATRRAMDELVGEQHHLVVCRQGRAHAGARDAGEEVTRVRAMMRRSPGHRDSDSGADCGPGSAAPRGCMLRNAAFGMRTRDPLLRRNASRSKPPPCPRRATPRARWSACGSFPTRTATAAASSPSSSMPAPPAAA